MPIFGVDVSHHQGSNLDWDRIRDSGIDFMFARASLATTPDEEYRGNLKRARQAGIPVLGAYHFLYPATVVSPAEQARLFVERTGDTTGLMTMLDVERDNHHKPHIPAIREFAEEFAHLTHGHPLLMYAPAWYWGIIGNPDASDLGALVASRYVHVDRNVRKHGIRMTPEDAFARTTKRFWHADHGGWKHATILQFTSFGRVKGHRGRIDVNAFRGTVQELAGLATPGVVPAMLPDDGPDDPPDIADDMPDEGIGHGGSSFAPMHTPRFHTVTQDNETLSGIAAAAGFKPRNGKPAFQVMIDKFPENAPFRAHPELIHHGDRVRIR
ncbi:MAG TPA: glycoside hydrolase family 25 protein [Candidatus Limnocylindrales bacterium]|jgi:hypothetical protein